MYLRIALVLFVLNSIMGTQAGMSQIVVEDFDEIKLYKLTNKNGIKIGITNYGAIITSIVVPDRDGNFEDIALGYDDVKSYMNAADKPYFGAIVGRYGNRIANGKFTIDNVEYQLATNNGPNHLHGGTIGFDKVVWDATTNSGIDFQSLVLAYHSNDMEEGYPGNLDVKVTYQLNDNNELTVAYLATTDKSTHVNLTQHTYFNLKGEGNGNILDHELMINADKFTPVDATSIPTGEIVEVSNTPFDFRVAKLIGRDIENDHQQLKFGSGFDHNWVLNGYSEKDNVLAPAATVVEAATGRTLEVLTTEPGIQFYCGNFLDGRLKGKSGRSYVKRGGFCLETQHFPDSPNHKNFPSTLLRPKETYKTKTMFRFGVQK